MIFNIFIPNKKGHYEDYSSFLNNLLKNHEVKTVRSFKEKLTVLFRYNQNVIFLNIDHKDMYWSLLRSLFSKKNFGVSVSVESLINKNNIPSIHYRNLLGLIKKKAKYNVFKLLKSSDRLKLISIHKMTDYEGKLKDITSFLTYDFQYYDLPYLNVGYQQPKELLNLYIEDPLIKSVLIFNNTSKAKKNLSELSDWIFTSNKYRFFIIGDSSFLRNDIKHNVVLINRYVSNEEMIYFMEKLDIIYCYYNNDKPSGFMGRAMQLNKKVIVPLNSYLGSIPYTSSIRVTSLAQMDEIDWDNISDTNSNNSKINQFDESELLREFLLQEA
ncbi:hypothetical protein [Spirosoma pollinicola]|uniref:Glycosyltransferase family 1 protein n=1 Tax=Spirosoma pollinicola TaxID=2057025 RepID=A0A2K8Z3Q7_9BACT|nr:hypothetical protein [Spirosoma pollinicola]AUD04464.1 hypothetical protein CWM47_23030 [Spirosoma pollinicola]